MQAVIDAKFAELLREGEALVRAIPEDRYGNQQYYAEKGDATKYQAWLGQAANLIMLLSSPGTYYVEELQRLVNHEHMSIGVVSTVVQRVQGLLQGAHKDWQEGLLRKIEYIFVAATFDDFLDHAEQYHKAGKHVEAGVLSAAVLEDTVKKIAGKHNIPVQGVTLDPLIDSLAKAQVFTPVKTKRVKSWSAVRNHALHAEWDKFDLKDVGSLISGLRELIEEHL